MKKPPEHKMMEGPLVPAGFGGKQEDEAKSEQFGRPRPKPAPTESEKTEDGRAP